MHKQQILDEIRRTAETNGGEPLGKEKFARETGIKDSDWYGKYWARWSDALQEAGFTPNKMQNAYEEGFLLEQFIQLMRELGRFPSSGDRRLKARSDPGFPSHGTFDRFGSRTRFASRLLEYCSGREGFEDVIRICRPLASEYGDDSQESIGGDLQEGFVYLLKSGQHYKIGRSNAFGRRERELAIQLPEMAATVHIIKTDDAVGIENYWHRRFENKRANGEWFALNVSDVKAFRRRKFM